MKRTSRRPAWRKRAASALFRVHSILGLLAGLALLVVGLTGALLIFSEDLDEMFFGELHHVQSQGRRLSYDQLFEAARQRNEGAHTLRVRRFPAYAEQSMEFLVGRSARGADEWSLEYVDPYTGLTLGQRGTAARGGAGNPFGVLLALHANFLAGKQGRLVLALLSLVLLGSVLTGALVYRRSITAVLRFRVKLSRPGVRVGSSTLHRVVGVWALGFNAVMAVTGFWMARAAFTPAFHRASTAEAQPALAFSLDELLAEIQARAPAFVPHRMSRVGSSGEARILGEEAGQLSMFSSLSSQVTFDARTGALKEVSLLSEASIGAGLEASVTPLHFGTFGGRLTQAAYCALGLALPLLSATGLLLWWRRSRRRSTAAQTRPSLRSA